MIKIVVDCKISACFCTGTLSVSHRAVEQVKNAVNNTSNFSLCKGFLAICLNVSKMKSECRRARLSVRGGGVL